MSFLSLRDFKGIDERTEMQDGVVTATEMHNFRVNSGGSIEKRGMIRTVAGMDNEIEGLWCGSLNGEPVVMLASGGMLYRMKPAAEASVPLLIGEIGEGECLMFEFGNKLYIKTDGYYGKYNGSILTAVEGYVPCVAISCDPNGSGESFEEINLISDKRRQLFSGDGSSVLYYLAESGVDEIVSITVDGEPCGCRYSLELDKSAVSFERAPAKGLNNVEIVYRKANTASDRERIMGCSHAMLFGGNSDGRVFLWGNPEYPNYRFFSSLADGVPSAEYFPVNSFTVVGNSRINCIVQQYERQLIFTNKQAYYSYCELREDALGNVISSFPVYSLNGEKGCLIETDGCVIDNRPITLCDDGLNMWESTSVVNEKNAVCFSMPISKTLFSALGDPMTEYALVDLQANRELYFMIDGTAYVYNYGRGVWYSYDGFWGKKYRAFGDTLYFVNGTSLYAYSERYGKVYEGSWQSGAIGTANTVADGDVVGITADMYIKGPTEVSFIIEKSNGEVRERRLIYENGEKGYIRVGLRVGLRRAFPFRIKFNQRGTGECVLHGITLRTRNRERSNRFGIY